ncbi:SDR family NAD(P)-dependent oxidoreductase [Sinimarinibacterium flocculans]|uniref:SDR family NAD(P)-dependent oxidoreductase n=1 Tax=Sinimarinibacterium flocculans TaxID=985250 RepID=UPI00248FDE96|nr:SDR family NAD(P)-dependent oxidoreductase [Sinimarinibacterium flocculans]
MRDAMRFDGRVAVVTGAGRGIGRAHALALAARGAKVIVNDLGGSVTGQGASGDPADQVVAEIVDAGGKALASHHDVTDPAAIHSLIDQVVGAFGRLDIVIANAGIFYPTTRRFADTSPETVERMWRSHVGGTYNVLRAAWPQMVAQGYGRLVTTTSQAAIYGQVGAIEYGMAKAGIVGLTLALAQESEAHGIRVNAVAPAGMTRMLDGIEADDSVRQALQQFFRPELVSPTVLWLAHEDCRSNGQVFEAAAGRTARVVAGEPAGVWADTPEALREHAAQTQSTEGLAHFAHGIDWAGWVIGQAMQRVSAGQA